MKKLSALLAAVVAAAAFAVPAATAGTKTIKIGDDYFIRKGSTPTIKVSSGTVLKWVWRGKVAHNVYQLSGPAGTHFHTSSRVKGTYSRRFKKRGTYTIVCLIHPGMEMKIKVH